jgi:hypothetical protein
MTSHKHFTHGRVQRLPSNSRNINRSILLSSGNAHCKLVDKFLRYIRMSSGHRPSQRNRYRDYATISNFQSLNSGRGRKFLSSPKHQCQFWYPFSPPFHRYWGSFPGLKRPQRDVDQSTLSIVPTLTMSGSILLLPCTPSCCG